MTALVDRARITAMTWPVASGSLVAGFAVAQATGVRPLGGIVLAAGAGWCAVRWRRTVGIARTAGLVGLYLVAFVASHLIADTLGTWGAVFLVAAIIGLAAFLVADLPRGLADGLANVRLIAVTVDDPAQPPPVMRANEAGSVGASVQSASAAGRAGRPSRCHVSPRPALAQRDEPGDAGRAGLAALQAVVEQHPHRRLDGAVVDRAERRDPARHVGQRDPRREPAVQAGHDRAVRALDEHRRRRRARPRATHAASAGSTPTRTRPGAASARTAADASAPTPICTATSGGIRGSCSASSSKIVA